MGRKKGKQEEDLAAPTAGHGTTLTISDSRNAKYYQKDRIKMKK